MVQSKRLLCTKYMLYVCSVSKQLDCEAEIFRQHATAQCEALDHKRIYSYTHQSFNHPLQTKSSHVVVVVEPNVQTGWET